MRRRTLPGDADAGRIQRTSQASRTWAGCRGRRERRRADARWHRPAQRCLPPRRAGPLPVLVCRTPYGKRGETFGSAYASTAQGPAQRGYIVVVQDVRGRYASGGVYRWLYGPEAAATHAQDGHDTIEWAATLPGASGAVGTWGNSYDGYTSLRAAAAAPPSLSAAFASGVAERLHDETFGIFKPIYLEWTHAMAADLRARAGKPARPAAAAFPSDMIWALPYDAIDDDAFADLTAPFKAFLREQEVDRWALHEAQPSIRVPVCHLTGWWDYVCRGTARHYVGLPERGAADLQERHRLVIGPWSHRTGRSAAGQGAVDYGPAEHVYYHDEIADWSPPPGSGQVSRTRTPHWRRSVRWGACSGRRCAIRTASPGSRRARRTMSCRPGCNSSRDREGRPWCHSRASRPADRH